MKKDTTKTPADMADEKLFDNSFDPIETALRTKVRGFIETLVEEELETALARPRYGRRAEPAEADNPDEPMVGHRHGHRMRSLARKHSARPISPSRAPGSSGKTARRRNGRARRCVPTSVARAPPTR